jgi:hypothetical protein
MQAEAQHTTTGPVAPSADAPGEKPAAPASTGAVKPDAGLSIPAAGEKAAAAKETKAPEKGDKVEVPAGLLNDADVDAFTQEFTATGALSKESRDKITAKGIPARILDQYIAGLKAQGERALGEAYTAAGGKDEYSAMSTWAAGALDESTLAAYNADVESGDMKRVLYAVSGMRARYEASGGQAPGAGPARYRGRSAAGAPTGAFESQAQVTRAMSDPRYKTDPAYRAEVAAALANSDAIKVHR